MKVIDCRSDTREETMTQEMGGPEAVAYALFERVCYVEGKDIGVNSSVKGSERPSRGWIFSTYAECLEAVKSPHHGDSFLGLEAHMDSSGRRHVPREAILASDPV
jgi:hypothetical protein